ncbi:hypothetical protein DRP04_14595 [Archaeoglobales archaeon]|nr:MAG: hypothetical protein DRP04_14595 [Archaeoglobales archaeon]
MPKWRNNWLWNFIKSKLSGEGAYNKLYDSQLRGIVDNADNADTVDDYHLADIQADAQNRVDSHASTNLNGIHGVIQDLEANMPAAGTAGRLFIATDTKRIYRDNGTSWDEIGGTSEFPGHRLWEKLPNDYDAAWSYVENLTDFDETTYAECSHADTNEHYVIYDLGGKRLVDCYVKADISGTLEGVTIKLLVSDDKVNWTELDSYTNKSDSTVTVELSGVNKARYVKVAIQAGSSTSRTQYVYIIRA